MDLLFDASGKMVWDIGVAVAWRLDSQRCEFLAGLEIKDIHARDDVRVVIVQNCNFIRLPPRAQRNMVALETKSREISETLKCQFVEDHVFLALDSLITKNIQDPETFPRLECSLGEYQEEKPVYIDVDRMVEEYRMVLDRYPLIERERSYEIKKEIIKGVTPRFDRLDTRLESMDLKLEDKFNKVLSKTETNESLLKQIRDKLKIQP